MADWIINKLNGSDERNPHKASCRRASLPRLINNFPISPNHRSDVEEQRKRGCIASVRNFHHAHAIDSGRENCFARSISDAKAPRIYSKIKIKDAVSIYHSSFPAIFNEDNFFGTLFPFVSSPCNKRNEMKNLMQYIFECSTPFCASAHFSSSTARHFSNKSFFQWLFISCWQKIFPNWFSSMHSKWSGEWTRSLFSYHENKVLQLSCTCSTSVNNKQISAQPFFRFSINFTVFWLFLWLLLKYRSNVLTISVVSATSFSWQISFIYKKFPGKKFVVNKSKLFLIS